MKLSVNNFTSMKKIFFVILGFTLLFVIIFILFKNINNIKKEKLYNNQFTCSESDEYFCVKDSDCVCTENQGCFFGNKNYYQKCASKTGECFDFCGGWGQTKPHCVKNRCSMKHGLLYNFIQKYFK